jgi:hypothetical protein
MRRSNAQEASIGQKVEKRAAARQAEIERQRRLAIP